jgi:3-phosphoshikimate 1-carboxyvinyltransferase
MSEQSTCYPDSLQILPLGHPPNVAVEVPGSKSITNRALVLAALTARGGACTLRGALRSEDTEIMIECLRTLGFRVLTEWADSLAIVSSGAGKPRIPVSKAELFVGNSGTTMRFLSAVVSLGHGRFRLDGTPRMRERPIGDLLEALQKLGVGAISEKRNGCPPVIVMSAGLPGGIVSIKGNTSSQFVSGLMLAAPFGDGELTIQVDGPLVSVPYVMMTARMLERWKLEFVQEGDNDHLCFRIPGGQRAEYVPHSLQTYDIEPDASAASYFFAAAAITGGRVTALGLPENSLQGDIAFVHVLADMGCRVEQCTSGITVHGRPLRGINVDMNAISDTVMTLAAVACFAEGPTTIRNVAHIRHKETDRLTALATELRRVGAEVEEFADGLTITPKPLHGAAIATYNDHRMAMSMALIGLKVPAIVIENPGCVAKTYPGFFADLEKLR